MAPHSTHKKIYLVFERSSKHRISSATSNMELTIAQEPCTRYLTLPLPYSTGYSTVQCLVTHSRII